MTKNTSIASRQERKLVEVVGVAAATALGITGLQKPAMQKLLARGGALQKSLTPEMVGLFRSYAVEFDPASFFEPGWSIDPNDEQLPSAPFDIDPNDISFTNVFHPGEPALLGEERWRRLREARHLYLNADHFVRFWNMRGCLPEKWEVVKYITFDATKLRGPNGRHYILFIHWRGIVWDWNYARFDSVISREIQSGVAGEAS